MKPVSKIVFSGIQFKSMKTLKAFCKSLSHIEELVTIGSAQIELKNIFVCGWIDIEDLSDYEMEGCVKKILRDMKIDNLPIK